MSKSLQLQDYYQAVNQWLKSQSGVNSTTDVKENNQSLVQKKTSAEFKILAWRRSCDQPMTGQLNITLSNEIRVIDTNSTAKSLIALQQLALQISQGIEQNRFGLEIEPATLWYVSPVPSSNNQVWSIRFEQIVKVGVDAYQSTVKTPTQINVSISPDIGITHKDDYVKVAS